MLKRFGFFWCERWDLNPYGITTRPSNVRVCRFRHSRVFLGTIKSIQLPRTNVKNYFYKNRLFRNFFE